jgi:molybdate transport system ATP-binding protein
MTALALGDQHMWVNKLISRFRLRAYPHSGLGRVAGAATAQQTSIQYSARESGAKLRSNGQVEVQLEVGGRTLWARISPWARDERDQTGLWLYAQIKSVSITA